MSEVDGTLTKAPNLTIQMIFDRELQVRGSATSQQAFLGRYEYVGLISSRPYYLQRVSATSADTSTSYVRYAIWYAEEVDHWVISLDFRLLDFLTVEAKAEDSAWFPWEVSKVWEVGDGSGGFALDQRLVVESTSHMTNLTPLASMKTEKGHASDLA